MFGLIRILLLALLFYYIFKFVFKLWLPTNNNPQQQPKQEGDVTIHLDKNHQEELKNKERKGEYVDYEEVE